MHARVSAGDVILYANNALADYLGVPKESLPGTPLEVIAGRTTGEVSACFVRPESGRATNKLVTDDSGRVFEAKTFSDAGVLDILLDEVTTPAAINRDLASTSGTPLDSLDEHELRTARLPERRYLTVTFSRMEDINLFVESMSPVESRVVVDAFLEETSDSIRNCGCTVASTTGDSVLGIFGAPRHYRDHPLRAVHAACDSLARVGRVHRNFRKQGKELPPFSCGIWTGEALIGSMGGGPCRGYTALGVPVLHARRLCAMARSGEILLPEQTLHHILRVLPEGWEFLRAESETAADLTGFSVDGTEILPLDESLSRVIYVLGPGVSEDPSRAEYYFEYLWTLSLPDYHLFEPILRVVRPSTVGDPLEFSDDNVLAASTGETLGKYRLMEVLGSGGMGRVWRGVDRFGNNVAIKVLQSSSVEQKDHMRRFQREAEAMARLPHRNICRVYEMNEAEGIQYIAMEYVDGLSLSDILYAPTSEDGEASEDLPTLIQSLKATQSHPTGEEPAPDPPRPTTARILPIQQTLSIIVKVCDAIQFAHEHGVLHRDVKPGNVLLRKDGEPLVADFGLAKFSTSDATASLSVSGHVVGTLENMPPEQAESSHDVDERADVYAIGTVLYLMLTGQRHFAATGNIVNDAQALKTHEPVKPRIHNPKIDADLEIITLKALRNDPAQRYPSVAALKADIERFLRGEVIAAKPVSALDLTKKLLKRNKAATGVAAGSLVLLAGIITLSLWSLSRQLASEQAARQESEALRLIAEENEQLADEKAREAEEKEKEALQYARKAEEQRLLAEKALQEKIAAEAAAAAAIAEGQRVKEESAAERAVRQKRLEDAREKARHLEEQLASLQQPATPAPQERYLQPVASPEMIERARRALSDAANVLLFELSPNELLRLSDHPEDVLQRLSHALDQASFALTIDPDFAPGWMIKGRLHLALMEFPHATEAFRRTQQIAAENGRASEAAQASLLESLSASSRPTFGQRSEDLARPLLASESLLDQAAGRGMRFFAGHETLRDIFSSDDNPFGRVPSVNEIAANLTARNQLAIAPEIVRAADTGQLSITIRGNAADLSPLAGTKTNHLTIQQAEVVDWDTVHRLGLVELNVSGCGFDSIPPHRTAYLKLKEFRARNSSLRSLEFLAAAPLVESIDVARSAVSQIGPVTWCRQLRSLNISGLKIEDFSNLSRTRITRLTTNPYPLPEEIEIIAQHRTLTHVRGPDDPQDLTRLEFLESRVPTP